MIEIGKINRLEYLNKVDIGLILGDGDREVFLPAKYAPENLKQGDFLDVFVFINAEGKMIATTRTPYACVGDFACLTVTDATERGVYMDLGVDKDVYVSDREMKRPMHVGEKHVVYIYLDERNDRLLGSSKLVNFVEEDEFDLEEGDEVELLIADQSDLGYNAIIENRYIGLLYQNEVFEQLQPGDIRTGYIKRIRPEDKIDLSLQPTGFKHILSLRDDLYAYLKENGGFLTLGDKSSPEDITRRLKISKKAFKKAIGGLYKERLIVISDYEIRLVEPSESK